MFSTIQTQEELQEILNYNPDTGVFTWKISTNSRIGIGDIAGSKNHLGYVRIKYNGYVYQAHQLAWLYVYGTFAYMIDHKDNDPSNNRIDNLREASSTTNGYNSRRRKDNSTGVKGIQFRDGRYPRYRAMIAIDGKTYTKSMQVNKRAKEDIISTLSLWLKSMRIHHKEFANHG